jgi:hypothetical protein
MNGWMLQWYVYVPAVEKVRSTVVLALLPGMSAGVPAFWVSKKTLCATDANAKVTLSPALIVTELGVNARPAVALTVPGVATGGGLLTPPVFPPLL